MPCILTIIMIFNLYAVDEPPAYKKAQSKRLLSMEKPILMPNGVKSLGCVRTR